MRTIYLLKENFDTNYQYRKAIKEYRDRGYSMVKVTGGVACFESLVDKLTWQNQK